MLTDTSRAVTDVVERIRERISPLKLPVWPVTTMAPVRAPVATTFGLGAVATGPCINVIGTSGPFYWGRGGGSDWLRIADRVRE